MSEKSVLQHLIKSFFYGKELLYKKGLWEIAQGGYDLVAEIRYKGIPVCSIYLDKGGYEVKDEGTYKYNLSETVKDVLIENGMEVTRCNKYQVCENLGWKVYPYTSDENGEKQLTRCYRNFP